MPQTTINKLTNGNIYLNGESYFGAFEEVSLPEVQAVLAEHKALGMIGKPEFPSGIDKMSCKIKWNGVVERALITIGDFYTPCLLQVRASLEKYDAMVQGRYAQAPVVASLRGQFKKLPGLQFKQMDNVEMESDFTVTGYQLKIDGVEIFDIDIIAQVFRVGNIDLMAQYRSNLGI